MTATCRTSKEARHSRPRLQRIRKTPANLLCHDGIHVVASSRVLATYDAIRENCNPPALSAGSHPLQPVDTNYALREPRRCVQHRVLASAALRRRNTRRPDSPKGRELPGKSLRRQVRHQPRVIVVRVAESNVANGQRRHLQKAVASKFRLQDSTAEFSVGAPDRAYFSRPGRRVRRNARDANVLYGKN